MNENKKDFKDEFVTKPEKAFVTPEVKKDNDSVKKIKGLQYVTGNIDIDKAIEKFRALLIRVFEDDDMG